MRWSSPKVGGSRLIGRRLRQIRKLCRAGPNIVKNAAVSSVDAGMCSSLSYAVAMRSHARFPQALHAEQRHKRQKVKREEGKGGKEGREEGGDEGVSTILAAHDTLQPINLGGRAPSLSAALGSSGRDRQMTTRPQHAGGRVPSAPVGRACPKPLRGGREGAAGFMLASTAASHRCLHMWRLFFFSIWGFFSPRSVCPRQLDPRALLIASAARRRLSLPHEETALAALPRPWPSPAGCRLAGDMWARARRPA